MSGLASAIRLAHFGVKALLLERHDRVGGLNSFYTAGGYPLDVGLHAMTNWVAADGRRSAPLLKLLRQLRMRLADFKLAPQKKSRILFPDTQIEFDNNIETLHGQINQKFPEQSVNFQKLVKKVEEYNVYDPQSKPVSGRKIVHSIITDPELAEIILTPIMFYGSSQEDDIDFDLFVILFRSVFLEGLARPETGIRLTLDLLTEKLAQEGGEIKLNAGVKKIVTAKGKVIGVELLSGEQIECETILSSAGAPETYELCGLPCAGDIAPGEISVFESINILDCPADKLGCGTSIIFYNNSAKLEYRKPKEPVDIKSGVICFADNFNYSNPVKIHVARVTHLANYRFWENADEKTYTENKKLWHDRSLEQVAKIGPDFRKHILFSDVFTPRTIKKFTGHLNGAIYGSAKKIKTGKTDVKGLFIIGADHGFPGIVGAMISGVLTANQILEQRFN